MAYNSSLASEGETSWVSFQLNAYLEFAAGAGTGVFWVQDVLEVNTSSGAIQVFDNIWNATSSPLPVIYASTVSGNGQIASFGAESYYGYSAPCSLPGLCGVRPSSVALEINTSVGTGNHPAVAFAFDDGHGWTTYDTPIFPYAGPVSSPPQFVVDDSLAPALGCARCIGDVELVAGGPDSGYNTTLVGTSDVALALDEWNGFNYASVPDAYDYGVSTAEGLSRGAVGLAASDGAPQATLTNGNPAEVSLWGSRSTAVVEVNVDTGSSGGTFAVNGSTMSFVLHRVLLVLLPGSYNLTVVSGATTFPVPAVQLPAGAWVVLEVGEPPVEFVPNGLPSLTVWSVTIGPDELNGTGNITFGEPPGNYSFTITALPGYQSTPASGTVVVGANGTQVVIDWTSNPPTFLGSVVGFVRAYWLPLAIGGVVLIGLAAALSSPRRPRRARAAPAPPGAPVTSAAPIRGPVRTCTYCGAVQPAGYASCNRCHRRMSNP